MVAEMWYYTAEGKQMDPVTIRELRRLVDDGYLKPTDMVWKDGMARWIRASSVKELFPDPGSDLDKYFSNAGSSSDAKPNTAVAVPNSSAAEPPPSKAKPPISEVDEPRPQRRKRRSSSEDDDDRSSRRRNEPKGGNSGIILLAVILGGGLVLIAVVVGVAILIFARGTGRAVPGAVVENPQPLQFVNKSVVYVEGLPAMGIFRRTIKLRKGVTYEFTVRSDPRQPDIDLYILNNNGAIEEQDDSFGPDSKIANWIPRDDGDYKIELRNLDEFTRVQSTVTIREVAGAPPEKKQPITEPLLPKDVLTGNGSLTVKALKPGEDQIFKFRVKAGHDANVKVVPFMPTKLKKAETDFNLFVLKDSDGAQIEADAGPSANADVNFKMQATEIIRVRVVNAGKTTPTKSNLYYNVAP